jgi:hypothetical protein
MKLSRPALAMLAVAIGAAILAWLVIVDLGVNAGRIHYGVSVGDVDVGGLTEADAARVLGRHGAILRDEPVVPTAPGLDCDFIPGRIGWGPQPFDTARLALRVGRAGGPIEALADRIHAWFGGVTVSWSDSPDPKKLGRLLSRCEKQAEALGGHIDLPRFKHLIDLYIVTWPRAPFEIPMLQS